MDTQLLSEWSTRFGTGDIALDVSLITFALVVISVVLVLGMMVQSAKRQKRTRDLLEKFPWGGKLEKLEQSVNQFQTETRRTLEFLKNDLEKLRTGSPASVTPSVATGDVQIAMPETPAPVLDLESEEAEKKTLEEVTSTVASEQAQPEALTKRLKSTRRGLFDRIRSVFSGKPTIDAEMVDELRALLIGADLGPRLVDSLVEEVKADLNSGKQVSETDFTKVLKERVLALLKKGLPTPVGIQPTRRSDGPTVVLVVGVNGVGKTTTVAKLSHQWKKQGAKVLMVAADTFRAAAVAQLSEWGKRIDVPVVTGAENAKPATVVFDAMQRVANEQFDVVIIDTAGRLQTKANLMQELEGIRNSIQRHLPSAPHETILVLDGSTGQNAISQAREFNEVVKLSGMVVTKLDGTPKGGVVAAIQSEFGIPVRYIGVGEAPTDLREFNPQEFVEALFDANEDGADSAPSFMSAHGESRRRRRSQEVVGL